MEIIQISGYTEDEKINIATNYLIEKQKKNNGLKQEELTINHQALTDIVRYYTREAGVRSLDREIAKISRKVTKELLLDPKKSKAQVSSRNVSKYLGVRRHRYGRAEDSNRVGQVTGLAWTEVGGELLTIETAVMPGKGKQSFTGKLGDVMKESIDAANSYVRSISAEVGIKPPKFDKTDIHVHVPEGATPKDGPSAGLAMVTSIVSVLTGIPVRKI